MNRYDRQLKCAAFGTAGQSQLEQATFFIIGAGALGSTICESLTRSGAGNIVICDMDVVDITNLHRQSCYTEADADAHRLKVHALKQHLEQVNHLTTIIPIHEEITGHNIITYLQKYQPTIVIDGTDNFKTRFMLNEACHRMNIPWIYGACLGTKGTVYAIDYSGPCLSCLFQKQPETGEDCSIAGILPPVAHIAASMQVAEVMNYMNKKSFSGKLITFDTSNMSFQHKDITKFKQTDCPTCHYRKYTHLNEPMKKITKLCGGKYMIRYPKEVFHETALKFNKTTSYFKYYEDNDYQISFFHDGRVIINGVETKEDALNLIYQLERAAEPSHK